MEILEYLDAAGVSRFALWFDELDASAAAKVTAAVQRMREGNLSNVKGVGAGVLEYRIDFGPGYESISDETEAPSSCCWAAGQSSGNSAILKRHKQDGPNTDGEKESSECP